MAELTLGELKSHAYDVIAGLESLQAELKATNERIAEIQKDSVDKVGEPTDVEIEASEVDETAE